MKNWEKIEEKLNLLLGSFLNFLKLLLAKSTPASIKASIDKRRGKALINLHTLQEKIFGIKKVIDTFIGKFNHYVGKSLMFFKTIELKKLDWEKIFISIIAIITPFFGRVRDWYIAMKPTTMLAMVSMTTMGGLSSIVIYQEVQNISEKSRTPASEEIQENVGEVPSRRPAYYKQHERELRVRNVSFPVYISANSSAKKLIIDFTFVSSNKYIKEYFYENIHLLKDKLNTSIEQIVPDFPLQDDGKRVIKEKIIKEMQILINELEIEGSIKEVYIHSIMTG